MSGRAYYRNKKIVIAKKFETKALLPVKDEVVPLYRERKWIRIKCEVKCEKRSKSTLSDIAVGVVLLSDMKFCFLITGIITRVKHILANQKHYIFGAHSLHSFCFMITLEQWKQKSLGLSKGGGVLLRNRKANQSGQFDDKNQVPTVETKTWRQKSGQMH